MPCMRARRSGTARTLTPIPARASPHPCRRWPMAASVPSRPTRPACGTTRSGLPSAPPCSCTFVGPPCPRNASPSTPVGRGAAPGSALTADAATHPRLAEAARPTTPRVRLPVATGGLPAAAAAAALAAAAATPRASTPVPAPRAEAADGVRCAALPLRNGSSRPHRARGLYVAHRPAQHGRTALGGCARACRV
jgi:hypothetical protein